MFNLNLGLMDRGDRVVSLMELRSVGIECKGDGLFVTGRITYYSEHVSNGPFVPSCLP